MLHLNQERIFHESYDKLCKTRETARGGHFEYVVLEGVEGKN
jgi:hypothetical protein